MGCVCITALLYQVLALEENGLLPFESLCWGFRKKRGRVLELVEGLGFEEWFSAEKGFALGKFLETVDLLYRVFHDLFDILSLPEG